MEKKLKVLMIVFNLSVANGVSSYVMNYFRNLDHDQISMDFVAYQDVDTPYYKEIEENGGNVFILPSIRNVQKHLKAAQKVILEGQYDIVHDNILILSYFLMNYAKKYGVPVRIIHSHNSRLGETKYKEIRNKLFMPILLSKVNTFFSCSDFAAKGMFGNTPYTFVPNVISSEKLHYNSDIRSAFRKKFDVDNQIVIGTVGRLAYQKNPFYALDVISKLYRINPNIQYWWIGDGPLEIEVKEYVHKLGIDSVVKLLGRRADVDKLYQAMDIFFLPSKFEGLPVTGVEAQAMGLPCIVSDTITKEFVYTDLVKFISIQEQPAINAGIIASVDLRTLQRTAYRRCLEESVFIDKNAGNFLLDIYHRLYSSCTL